MVKTHQLFGTQNIIINFGTLIILRFACQTEDNTLTFSMHAFLSHTKIILSDEEIYFFYCSHINYYALV